MRFADLLNLKLPFDLNIHFLVFVICINNQISLDEILALVSMIMFNLNKIRGHIKMLEFEQLKLTRYADEALRIEPRNPKREEDIQRALRRVNSAIEQWTKKLEAITQAPARPPERRAVGSDDPDRPLIG